MIFIKGNTKGRKTRLIIIPKVKMIFRTKNKSEYVSYKEVKKHFT